MTTVTQITPKQSEQPTTSATPDLASLKIRQQAAWSSGNYAIVGTAEASSIKAEPRSFNFRYRSPEHFSRCVQNFLWPSPEGVRGARADEAGRASRRSARSKIVRMNRAGDGTMIVPSEYLEVVITKR